MAEIYNDDGAGNQFFVKKIIQELQPNEAEVQILGYARDKNANDEFYLDDTTGRIHIREIPEEAPLIQEGKLYRVFGTYALDGSGSPYIATQILQDMEDIDFEYYMKSLKKKQEIP